jgi:hypothetical protein
LAVVLPSMMTSTTSWPEAFDDGRAFGCAVGWPGRAGDAAAGWPNGIFGPLSGRDGGSEAGAGKGDLLKIEGNHAINSVTGKISYPHQQQEICYEWNNTHTPTGKALKFNAALNCSIKEGRDYINLGNGRPANTIPDEVKKFYTAKVNGVAYVGEFTYPHPLRGGSAPTPPPSVSPTPSPTKK